LPASTPTESPRVAEVLVKDFPERAAQIPAILEFLDAGAPAAFLLRYRRERTGISDASVLRRIRDRRAELAALEARREKVRTRLAEKNALTEDLARRIDRAQTRDALEDLFFAHRDGVRSAEESAWEERLGPLVAAIVNGEWGHSLADLSEPFLNAEAGLADVETTVNAAVSVMSRRIYEDAEVRSRVRDQYRASGKLRAKAIEGADIQKKYETYHDFTQSVSSVPTHRILAVLRGAREKILEISIEVAREKILATIRGAWVDPRGHPWERVLERAIEEAFDGRIRSSMESELLRELKERADREAVRIFARNLRQLLLSPPAGRKVVLGVDPGVRRGCKIAVVDASGDHQRHASIYPFANPEKPEGKKKVDAARKTFGDFCRQFDVELVGVGGGPGCREVERFLREVLRDDEGLNAKLAVVNDAGLSAYATSPAARKEFPKLDPRVRAAVSLARRLQDPLAELVKIEPRLIGVGPYQREVDQSLLDRTLAEVVETCVATVGADPNTASLHLLARVPGVGHRRARALLSRRTESGPFRSRSEIREVEGFGGTAWVFAAPFLRIVNGENPLDATRIHPEGYAVVETMAEKLGIEPAELLGNERALASLDPDGFVDDRFGPETIGEVFAELGAAGADPRGVYEPPAFREDLKTLEDLEVGMVLEGVVTNIASFGAFVDVGVDQEGLVHVSELSEEFVEDPGGVVSVGERVKVRVLAVDKERRRLSLSRRKPGARKPRPPRGEGARGGGRGGRPPRRDGGPRRGDGRKGKPTREKSGERRTRKAKGRKGTGEDRRGGRSPRGGRKPRGGGKRTPLVHEQKTKRESEPKIDPDLPEEEKYKLKLERLRRKFEEGH
jgi:uncharacterized protein